MWFFRKNKTWAAALVIVLPLLLTTPAPAADQANIRGPIDLDQALRIALRYSPTLAAARHQLTGAKALKAQAITGYLPTLSATYSFKRIDPVPAMEVPSMGTIAMADENTYSLQAAFEQPIFTGFRITAQYTMAKLGVGVAELQVQLAKLDVALAVKTAYFQYLASQKALVTAKQAVELLKSQLKTTQDFHDVGIVPVNAVLKVKVELASARQRATAAANVVALARSRLNTLLGRSVNAPLEVRDILGYHKVAISLGDAIRRAKAQRPELKAMRLRMQQADWAVTKAASGFYPQVVIQGAYTWAGTDWNLGGGGVTEPHSWHIMAAAKWNFWEWGRTYQGVSKARADKRALKAQLRQLDDQVVLQVKEAYLRLRDADNTIATARAAVAAAKENYRITQERYKEQLTTNTELLDAQNLLTRAQNDLTGALTSFNVALASLRRAMGTGLPMPAKR